jgi:hypothetical protein
MMKTLFFTLFFLTLIMKMTAQIPSCDGKRYRDFVFGTFDSVVNVQYGLNTTMNHVPQPLTLDVYYPHSDSATSRPLIIFIHGGAFIYGDKQEVRSLCILFALKGFITASINYRLIDVPIVDSVTVTDAIVKAMSDAKAAIRFFVEDANTQNLFRTDTNYIFISGISAGGIIATHVAYLDTTDNIPSYMMNLINQNGGFRGNSSSNTSYTTPIKGVINYSGALLREDFISEGEPALYSVHDQLDTIVPCFHGFSFTTHCIVSCDGSCAMQAEANFKGVTNAIFLNPGYGHCAYFHDVQLTDTVIQRTADFLYELICNPVVAVPLHLNDRRKMGLFPNPADETINIVCPAAMSNDGIIRLFNAMGVLLKEVPANPSVQINISGLPKGLYGVQCYPYVEQFQFFIKM